MAPSPPLLDKRTIDDIMQGLSKQARIDLPEWKQSPPDDAGVMLQRIFARLMEIALQRLNRVPEKNLRAFLDAMGVSLRPASPAKAPLTFSLLPNTPPTFVPRGAQAGTRPGLQAPVMTFETMRDFTVVPAQLVRAFTMDPVWDRFADRSSAVAGLDEAGFTPFAGVERMPHVLFIGDDVLLNCTVPVFVTLGISGAGTDFWSALIYEYASGGALLIADREQNSLVLKLDHTVDQTVLAGVGLLTPERSRWLQLSLPAPITDFVAASKVEASGITLSVRNQSSFAPDMAFSDQTPLDLTKDFLPFGSAPDTGSCLYLSSAEAFAKPNTSVTLNVGVAASDQVVLLWEYFDANRNAWSRSSIQDGTGGFSKDGTISAVAPGGSSAGRRTAVAIRARPISGAYRGFPAITGFDIRDTAKLAAKITGTPPTNSPQSVAIKVDASDISDQGDASSAFAAIGQVVAVDNELAVVTNIAGNSLVITPAPAKDHPANTPVTLKYAKDVGALIETVPQGGKSLRLKDTSLITKSAILLIDDPSGFEFVTVKDIDGNTVSLGDASFLFKHAAGTSIAVVTQLHLFCMANDRWVDTAAINEQNPLVPFGVRPGPGNVFQLFADFMGLESGGLAAGDATSPAAATVGPGTGPQVQINFHVKIDPHLPDVDIVWEYFGASGWVAIDSPADGTNSFQNEGPDKIGLKLGTLVPGQVNNQQGYWIRARIVRGNYGVPLTYAPVDPAQPALGYAVVPGSGNLHPPILSSLKLDYVTDRKSPERLVTQNGFLFSDRSGTSEPFAPFVPLTELVPFEQADPEPAFYLGFDAAFPEEPVTLYFDAKARTFSTGIVREISTAPSLMDRLPALRWEYFNGAVWTALPVVDWTKNLTETGELEFLTPLDMQPLSRFDSVARYWIRARSASNTKARQAAEAEFSNDPLTTQELAGVFVNTTTVAQGVSVTREVLGSSDGSSSQTFRLARTPVLAGQQIMIREQEPPSGEELEQLLAEESSNPVQQIANAITGEVETWVRWHEVSNFLASAPNSRHYVLDHSSGTLTFAAMIPPAGSQNVVASYRSGGGSAGNLSRRAIGQIVSTLPGVASVTNPSASDGGSDAETVAMIKERGPQTIKNRGRAVAAEDFEWLAHEAGGSRVARAKCIPNVNQELVFEPGWTTLLIVPNGSEAKPIPSPELIADIESYLLGKGSILLAQQTPARINVIGAGYIRVTVSAKVVPADLADAIVVQQRVLAALASYFNPITGGGNSAGWGFGQPVYVSKVSKLIGNVLGVDHVTALQLIPNIVQHRLSVDSAGTSAHVQQPARRLRTVERSKAARLPAADVGGRGFLISGFKEGDQLVKVIDVKVDAVGSRGKSLTVKFTADSTGVPRGSVVMTFDGQQRARLLKGIIPGGDVTSLELDDALTLQPNDVVTLIYPFPMTVRAATPESIELTVRQVRDAAITVSPFVTSLDLLPGTAVTSLDGNASTHLVVGIKAGQPGLTQITVAHKGFGRSLIPGNTILLHTPSQRLDIESFKAVMPFDSGSVLATLDNAVRAPLIEGVAAGQQITKIRLQDFAPGDSLAPIGDGSRTLTVRRVEPVYDQVVIDDNFLVYSGAHRVAMVEE